jgi:hypothetical protein
MTLKLIASAAIFVAALLPAAAQAPGAGTVNVRALAFTPAQRVDDAYAHDPAAADGTPASLAPVKTYLNHEVSPVVLTGRKIVFTTKPERASLKVPGEVIGEATLPAGVRSAILLFLPAESGEAGKARVLVIPDSKSEFPPGSFRISNLSPLPVQIKLEKKDFNFQPGQTRLIEDPPMNDTEHAGMEAFAFIDNQPRRIAASLWPNPGTGRNLAILYQNEVNGHVQLRSFDDVTPRDPQPITAP